MINKYNKPKNVYIKEREVVHPWLSLNIEETSFTNYCLSQEVYSKFINDTGLKISHISFGSYLNKYLNRRGVSYISIHKSVDGHCYFGITIKGVKTKTQYFDLYYHKRVAKNKKREKHALILGYFNKTKFEKWASVYLLLDAQHLMFSVTTKDLYKSYCLLYNIDQPATQGNLIEFGKYFNKYIIKKYPFISKQNMTYVVDSNITTVTRYNCIKLINI